MIGITGGIGSGKSTIARELARQGFAVYDCDLEAKRIITQDPDVRKAIIALLGEEAFVDGQYNTQYVARRVFDQPDLLVQLNAIVHPKVTADLLSKKPDFVESAILFEAGLNHLCDKIIVVDAPEEVRISRTISRDYHGQATQENKDKVRARMHTQHTHPGDLTILNDGKTSIPDLVSIITHWM